MKTVVLAFIPIISAVIGYLISAGYKESSDFWDSFLTWHKKIKSEIAFSQSSLTEIFAIDDKTDAFLCAAKEYLSNNEVSDKLSFLSKEEKSFLEKYLTRLGTTDKDSQLDFLNSMENELNSFRNSAEMKHKKMRPLYVKLGFLLGLIVFILVV